MIKVVERNADISYFYSITEEEKKETAGNELKVSKELPYPKETGYGIKEISKKRSNYHFYILHHYDQVIDVVLPPPEHIA